MGGNNCKWFVDKLAPRRAAFKRAAESKRIRELIETDGKRKAVSHPIN